MKPQAAQMDLFSGVDTADLPAWILAPRPTDGDAMEAACELDRAFPTEQLPEVRVSKDESFTITLREIEEGVVLWGVWTNKGYSGHAFGPLRKWGPEFAATSRAAAVRNATEYAVRDLKTLVRS